MEYVQDLARALVLASTSALTYTETDSIYYSSSIYAAPTKSTPSSPIIDMKIITNCEYPHYNEMHPTTLWDNWKNVSMTHCCCPLQRCRRWLQQFLTCQASAYPAISEEEAGESCGGKFVTCRGNIKRGTMRLHREKISRKKR